MLSKPIAEDFFLLIWVNLIAIYSGQCVCPWASQNFNFLNACQIYMYIVNGFTLHPKARSEREQKILKIINTEQYFIDESFNNI